MELEYKLKIENPLTNQIEVKIYGLRPKKSQRLRFFIPAYCPGNLTLKNYSQYIYGLFVTNKQGEPLNFKRLEQNLWEILFDESEVKGSLEEFIVHYRVACIDKPPFYSFIDLTSAYLLGASILMNVEFASKFKVTLDFPAIWSKINTSLEDISEKAEEFVFTAPNYEILISTPILIGCHETDGFGGMGGDHHLSFNMEVKNLKSDLIKIISAIESMMGGHPCQKYHFIFDFLSTENKNFGFRNTSVFLLDGKILKSKNFYKNFLIKIVSSYLNSFENLMGEQDFSKETHSSYLWVGEGLRCFLSPIILLKAKIISENDFLDIFLKKIILYMEMSGKYYQELSDNSFSQWQKSFRSNLKVNRSLKGFILFLFIYAKSAKELAGSLTLKILQSPQKIFLLIQSIGDPKVFDKFETFALTTEDIDFYSSLRAMGISWKIAKRNSAYLGSKGAGMKVKSVVLGGPFYKAGILPGDQILKVDNRKISTKSFEELEKKLKPQRYYIFTIKRDLKVLQPEVLVEAYPEKITALIIEEPKKFEKFLNSF